MKLQGELNLCVWKKLIPRSKQASKYMFRNLTNASFLIHYLILIYVEPDISIHHIHRRKNNNTIWINRFQSIWCGDWVALTNCISTQITHVASISLNKSPFAQKKRSIQYYLWCVYCYRWWLYTNWIVSISYSRMVFYECTGCANNQSTDRNDHSSDAFFTRTPARSCKTSNLHSRQLRVMCID